MKPFLITTFLSILFLNATSQSKSDIDTLINKICLSLKADTSSNDSIRYNNIVNNYLLPYLKDKRSKKSKKISEYVYYRMQRDCIEFNDLMIRFFPPKDDSRFVLDEPVDKIDSLACFDFFTFKNFKYLESSGDTTNTEISDSIWIDHFTDRTYSKCGFNKINECEFVLTFIKGNNLIRKNYSKKGEHFRYTILRRIDNYYELLLETEGVSRKSIIRLYY